MKIIAKMAGDDLMISCTAGELARITGRDSTYVPDVDRIFPVGSTIGLCETFDVFKQAANSPVKLAAIAKQMHDEADYISKLAANYSRVITPPVKPVK